VSVNTTRFGVIDVAPDRVIELTAPILGFPGSLRYAMMDGGAGSPFTWLQSLEEPDLAFVTISPFSFFPGYDFELPDAAQDELELESVDDVGVLALVTIPKDPSQMTANLLAPVVINTRSRRAKQVVLYDTEYTTKHFLLPEAARQDPEAATQACGG